MKIKYNYFLIAKYNKIHKKLHRYWLRLSYAKYGIKCLDVSITSAGATFCCNHCRLYRHLSCVY